VKIICFVLFVNVLSFIVDMNIGKVGDVRQLGITESFKLKKQVLLSASEAAEMILRVDDIIRCAPRQRQG
jgi:T-complex protein 1 subunit beta